MSGNNMLCVHCGAHHHAVGHDHCLQSKQLKPPQNETGLKGDERIPKMIEMKSQGMTHSEIGKAFGVTKKRVVKVLRYNRIRAARARDKTLHELKGNADAGVVANAKLRSL